MDDTYQGGIDMREPTLQRFWKKVAATESGCWEGTGGRNKDGYGSFWSGEYIGGAPSRGPVMILAHRWSYENFVGPIPADLYVLHRCDNPSCVNHEHLFLGTQRDNVADCEAKGRRNQGRPANRLNGRWTRLYDACIDCGSSDGKHAGHGLCMKCYTRKRRA